MRSNRIAILTMATLTIVSCALMIGLSFNALCLAVFSSLFTGCIVGFIIPTISFFTIRKSLQIEFHSICVDMVNSIRRIANWYEWEEKYIDYKSLNNVEIKDAKELEILNYWRSKMDDKTRKGLELIFDYSNLDSKRYFEILDDYCGLFKRNTKIKKKMFELRDKLNSFNIYYVENKNVLRSANSQKYAFNGEICLRDVFEPYSQFTKIKEGAIEDIVSIQKEYLELTKIVAYTAKMQGNKK